VKNKLERMWNEAVVAHLVALPPDFPRRTHNKPRIISARKVSVRVEIQTIYLPNMPKRNCVRQLAPLLGGVCVCVCVCVCVRDFWWAEWHQDGFLLRNSASPLHFVRPLLRTHLRSETAPTDAFKGSVWKKWASPHSFSKILKVMR
jgi:hypothetical protein